MVTLRSRRLEALLGGPLDSVAAEDVESLVLNGVTEEFDLDFKQSLYGRSDADRRDLAGDVAALANTAGGVIIIGVQEDDQARASAAEGVHITDTERARMLQVIASGVSPMPLLDILQVEKSAIGTLENDASEADTDGRVIGFFLIAVPRSPSGPHAVLINQGLRYPKRNGATTRYLAEPEVAAAYRGRFSAFEGQAHRAMEIEDEAAARLDRAAPWVVVSLLPDLPGDLEISHQVYDNFVQQVVARPIIDQVRDGSYTSTFARASVGRKRLVAHGSVQGPPAGGAYAEYHWDGSGTYALELFDMWGRVREESADPDVNQLVSDEQVVVSVLTGLRRLAMHARDRAATSGNALARVHVLPGNGKAVEIGCSRRFGPESRSKVSLSERVEAAETVVCLDELAEPGPLLVAAAARMVDEVGQAFGVPEMGQLTRDGEIRINYFGLDLHPAMQSWASRSAVTITDSGL